MFFPSLFESGLSTLSKTTVQFISLDANKPCLRNSFKKHSFTSCQIIIPVACVASVSVRFRSKARTRNESQRPVLQYKYAREFQEHLWEYRKHRKRYSLYCHAFCCCTGTTIRWFFFLHIFFRKQKTLESVWRTKRSQFLNLQALCLLRRSFFLWFTNKSKIATAHKRIAKETNFCDGLVNES